MTFVVWIQVPTTTTPTSTARTLEQPQGPTTPTNASSLVIWIWRLQRNFHFFNICPVQATTGTVCQCTACARTLMEWYDQLNNTNTYTTNYKTLIPQEMTSCYECTGTCTYSVIFFLSSSTRSSFTSCEWISISKNQFRSLRTTF